MRRCGKRSFTRLLEWSFRDGNRRFGGCRAAFFSFVVEWCFCWGFWGNGGFGCGAFVVSLWWNAW
jgi:hypothetical protein